ncbi:MAG: hypothetical protein PSV36_14980, partial [Algoriphagus sp.]|nr:hypothetical protein [Algoriphagus sp.]
MRKLTAILFLGMILYSCTETEKPDQLNLEEKNEHSSASGFDGKEVIQIPSQAPKGNPENAMIMASFTPIEDVSGDYTTETTLLDMSGIPCFTDLTSVTDGFLTLDFDKTMNKRQPDNGAFTCGWNGTFGNFPEVEGPNPHILYSNGQNTVSISLSVPVKTFGFEIKANLFGGPFEYRVDFYSEGNLIGSINEFLNAPFLG